MAGLGGRRAAVVPWSVVIRIALEFSEEFESKKVWTPKQEAVTEERGQIRVETQHSARWNKGVRSANVNLNDADCSRNGMNMDAILPRVHQKVPV